MNLLITGAWQDAKQHFDSLREMGHQIHFQQYEKDPLTVDEEWVEGIICNGFFLYHDIRRFKHLRYIQLTSAGYDRVPMKYVEDHQIEIHNARGVYSIPMAEFVITGILDFFKRKAVFFENQKKHLWEKQRDLLELNEKKVFILGCGNVGDECAKRFKAFNCTIVGFDLIVEKKVNYDKVFHMERIKDFIYVADIILISLPLTKQTFHLFNKELLYRCKDEAIIFNVSRGAVINLKDLEEVLENKNITVMLDVFEDEPLRKESSLWDNSSIIITPHNSFVGDGNPRRLKEVIIRNMSFNKKIRL